MNRGKLIYVWILLFLFALPSIGVCKDPRAGGMLRASLYHEVVTGDPHLSNSFVDRQLLQNVYNTLVAYDAKMNIVPELAESWTNPDNTTYLFKLRKGVKFHDGSEFNAEAVKFSLDRVLDPNTKSPARGEISAIKSIEVVDPYTVKIVLSYPFAPLLDGLTDRAGFMISPAAFKKMGADEFGQHPVGSGPFQFEEWVRDDHLSLKRFEGYWEKDLPYLDRLVFKAIPDQAVKLTNLKSGALEVIDDVLPKDVTGLKSNKEVVFHEIPSFGFNGLRLNCTKPPFNNKALRQAVSYAVDYGAIWKHIFYGTGVQGHGPIAPSSWAYDPKNFRYTYSPEKARAKLKEGGKPEGFKFKIYTKISPIDVQVCQAIQAQLNAIGIQAEIVQLEGALHLKTMLDKDYDANYGLWSGYSEPDTNLYRQFHPKGSATWTGYTHPRVTELLDQARASLNQGERKKLYSQALNIIIEEAPQVFIYYYPRWAVTSPKAKDFVLPPDGKLRYKAVWLQK
jgi:peptide/nickel transport system substrate-binding protein